MSYLPDSYEERVLREALARKAAKGDLGAMEALGRIAAKQREERQRIEDEIRRTGGCPCGCSL